MKQILLVLRKDCRKFWPEILLSLAVTGAFIAVYPVLWTSFDPAKPSGWLHLDLQHLQILARTVTGLLPVAWLVLIARVIHDENLVGNRQFWVTRPYIWQYLMAEKLLFTGIFVCIPFTVAQAALLVRAGFHPAEFVPALAYSLLLILITVIVPLLSLAAVTSSLLRMIGTLLVIGIVIIALAFLASTRPDDPSVSIPYSSDRIVLPMILAFCLAVLVVQYSVRKLWLSRTLLVALLLSLGVASVSPFDASMLELIYDLSAPGKMDPIRVTLSESSAGTLGFMRSDSKYVYLNVPVDVTGISNGSALTADDIRVTIDSPGGQHWVSPWQALYRQRLTPSEHTGSFDVAVDKAFFDRVKSGPVSLAMNVAFTEIAPGQSSHVNFVAGKDFSIPQVGICKSPTEESRFTELSCRVPFHQPAFAQISATESPLPCDAENPIQPGWRLQFAWLGDALSPALSDIGFTPVWQTRIVIPHQWYPTGKDEEPYRLTLCPGAPITITPFRLVRRFQSQFRIGDIRLPTAAVM